MIYTKESLFLYEKEVNMIKPIKLWYINEFYILLSFISLDI